MNRFLVLFCVLLFSFQALHAREQPTNLCKEKGTVFGFFNGVDTTKRQAKIAKEILKKTFGEYAPGGEKINYELFYNYTNGFEDFVETFEQRLKEQNGILKNRFELFFQVLHKKGSWWERMVAIVSKVASLLSALVNDLLSFSTRQITRLGGHPNTTQVYVEHKIRIDNLILEGNKLLFFAHSQGNLFANAAYDYARTKVSANAVKVVHVAPASPSLRGSHTLADLDLVINGLRVTGGVPSITNYMPEYLSREQGINGKTDALGHGLLEIYLNPSLPMLSRIRTHVNTALNTLVAPHAQASPGSFTATLTWNGPGDVDLHIYEPDNYHVYYTNHRGTSGRLDVDNAVANGPEHYYASCEKDTLLLGNYRIGVSNYIRAEGRTATIQVSSSKDGVLGTKSVTLGEKTGNTSGYMLFNVKVEEGTKGEYHISLD